MDCPKTLNGFPVILTAPRGIDAMHVIVRREGAPGDEYVKATWAPPCGDSWVWGHYCNTLAEAQACAPEAQWRAI